VRHLAQAPSAYDSPNSRRAARRLLSCSRPDRRRTVDRIDQLGSVNGDRQHLRGDTNTECASANVRIGKRSPSEKETRIYQVEAKKKTGEIHEEGTMLAMQVDANEAR